MRQGDMQCVHRVERSIRTKATFRGAGTFSKGLTSNHRRVCEHDHQARQKEQGDDEAQPIDETFVNA